MKKFLILCVLLTALLSACSSAPTQASQPASGAAKPAYTNITPPELQTMLKNKDFIFVNVHIPFEGNIAQTDVSIAYDTIDQHLDQLPADKNAKIVLYCRSGNMSDIAGRDLAKLGYTNLYNLDGGFNAWKAAGLPMEMEQK